MDDSNLQDPAPKCNMTSFFHDMDCFYGLGIHGVTTGTPAFLYDSYVGFVRASSFSKPCTAHLLDVVFRVLHRAGVKASVCPKGACEVIILVSLHLFKRAVSWRRINLGRRAAHDGLRRLYRGQCQSLGLNWAPKSHPAKK